jgi:hypothetical protein
MRADGSKNLFQIIYKNGFHEIGFISAMSSILQKVHNNRLAVRHNEPLHLLQDMHP